MLTYFVRHTKGGDLGPQLRDALWDDRRFGIHFEDTESVDPRDYKKPEAKRAIARLNSIAAEGGYVCATYWGKPGCLIGEVEAQSTIQTRAGPHIEQGEPEVIYKTLKMKNAQTLTGADALRLLLLAPRQGTIRRWKAVDDRVERLVQGLPIEIDNAMRLAHFEQEVMCSEFVRIVNPRLGIPRLQCLVSKIGGTQEAVDFFGVDVNDQWVFAQVTARTREGATQKVEDLKRAGVNKGAVLLFFCQCDKICSDDGVTYVPLQLVFEEMRKQSWWRKSVGMPK